VEKQLPREGIAELAGNCKCGVRGGVRQNFLVPHLYGWSGSEV